VQNWYKSTQRAKKQLFSQAILQDLCLPALSACHKLYSVTRNTGVHNERGKKTRRKEREKMTNSKTGNEK